MAQFVRVGRHLVNADQIASIQAPKPADADGRFEAIRVTYNGGNHEIYTHEQGGSDLYHVLAPRDDESPKQQTPGGQYA